MDVRDTPCPPWLYLWRAGTRVGHSHMSGQISDLRKPTSPDQLSPMRAAPPGYGHYRHRVEPPRARMASTIEQSLYPLRRTRPMTKDPLMCIVVRLKHSQLAQLKALGLSIGSHATAED